jgi:hypothetical protein
VCRVAGTPHDPGRGSGKSASEGEHLHTGVPLEGGVRDNAVLDGIRSSCTDSDGAEHLEDGAEDHGLSVRDGSRGDTGGPGVCDIVGTVVVGVQQGKEGAYGENIGVLVEHLGGCETRYLNQMAKGTFLSVVKVEGRDGKSMRARYKFYMPCCTTAAEPCYC